MKFKKLILILFYLTAIAISIKSFREPDLWWQIRTGEWIIQHHEVPKVDVFSYTMNGIEWINIKWGFEVAAAFVADHFGAESVFILQAIVNCLLMFFLLKLSKLFFRQKFSDDELKNNSAYLFSGVIAFLLVMIASEYRMIGRPEMISHLITIVFLYLLEKNRQIPSKQIYLLIPLQMLWANLHEAFGIGIVILIIYTISAWLEKFLSKEKKSNAVKMSLITLGAIVSVIINPYGIKLLTRPFNIMSQVYSNKYTTELLGFTSHEWWKKEAYLCIIISLVSIITIVNLKKSEKSKSSNLSKLISKLNTPYLISIFAFLYLGLTAYRNLIFLSLICFPVFHYSLFAGVRKWFEKSNAMSKFSAPVAVILLVLFYVSIVSNQYYKLTNSRDRFGLEVLSVNNPTGAADYILQNNLKSKKCFSDYLTSSYLMWKLQPDFKTYIDLRDLDVFPPEFFNHFLQAVNSPLDFIRLDSAEHFDYAVLFRPQFDQLHSYLYNDSVYALKYVDAVAAVYEKTDTFTRNDIFSPCKPVKAGTFATTINKVLNPFYSSYNYSSVENGFIAANYFLNVNRFELAKQRADALIANNKTSYKGHELEGQIYYRTSLEDTSTASKNHFLVLAEESYLQSLRENKNYAQSFLGLGVVHYTQQNYTAAISDFKKSLAIDDENYQAQLSIAQCYRELMSDVSSRKEEYRKELLEHFLKANSLNPGNPMVMANIGFVYFQVNDCDHAVEYLSKVSGVNGLSSTDSLAVQNCLRQCGY